MLNKKSVVTGGAIVATMGLMWFVGWVQGMRLIQAQDFNWQRVNDATRARYLLGIAALLRDVQTDKAISELEADAALALWMSSQDHAKKTILDVSRWNTETVTHWQEAKQYFAKHPATIHRDRPTNFKVVRDLFSQIPALEREGLEQDFMKLYTGRTPPALHIQEWIGPETTLTQLRGNVVLLDFWHIECPGCITRMPHLQQLEIDYGKRGLKVLAIHSSRVGDYRKVPSFLREHRYHVPVGLDKQSKTEANYAVQAWPTYYLIDRQGHLAWGPSHDLPSEQTLLPLLNREP
jgi:thiol-disulfide isomerase/thioredoxin